MAQFYTLEEAARVLGMSPEELKAKAQQREVRAFMDSGSWRFRVADIDELGRRRGMGSDPDLALADLEAAGRNDPSHSGSEDFNLSEFQLGVASPELVRPEVTDVHAASSSEQDVLLDDLTLPPNLASSSSTIIGMESGGKLPGDSDVRILHQGGPPPGSHDSDVRLAPDVGYASGPARGSSDSDVRLVPDARSGSDPGRGSGDSDVRLVAPQAPAARPPAGRPGQTGGVTLVSDESAAPGSSDPDVRAGSGQALGSSAEVKPGEAAGGGDSSSDFELSPSSVIDALQPESGSDFELTALDPSDEFEATPLRGPSDSDVTGAEPAASGINLGRPSDSGINLQSVGKAEQGRPDSMIGLTPLESRLGTAPAPAPAPAPAKAEPAKPQKVDLSATALPMKADKNIFEDTDFEVDAMDTGHDDRTVHLEADSDFDIDETDSGSEVFAVDEDDVDQNAATALGPALAGVEEEDPTDTSGIAEDLLKRRTVSQHRQGEVPELEDAFEEVAVPVRAPALVGEAPPSGEGLWIGVLTVTSILVILSSFLAMDLVRASQSQRDSTAVSGLIKQISGTGGR